MRRYKVNEPIRIAEKENSVFEILVTREFNRIEVNENVLEVIQHLNAKKAFSLEDLNSFLDEKNIINSQDYHALFDFLVEYQIIVETQA